MSYNGELAVKKHVTQQANSRAQGIPSGPNLSQDKRTATSRGPASRSDDPAVGLADLSASVWSGMDVQQRSDLLTQLTTRYQGYLAELAEEADLCVERYQQFSESYKTWRIRIIVGTGIVAMANLLAANRTLSNLTHNALPIVAAVLALALTILANLESFFNLPEKMRAYRESREMFLDAARDFERVWNVYVRPFTVDHEAWTNAVELHRRIVIRDRELRSAFRDMTLPKKN
jgi:Protein of unknown function (DUF4231)